MGNLHATQVALLTVYTPEGSGTRMRGSQSALLAPYSPPLAKGFNMGQAAALVAYAPPQSRDVNASQAWVMAPYVTSNSGSPKPSQAAIMAVWANFVPTETRSRAWSFTLDGHTFYVLDLGPEGTFAYDLTTQQWCQFQTNGFTGWNMRNGTQFANSRIAGADTGSGFIWELVPDALLDEGFRDVQHYATGGLPTRSRTYLSCDAVRVIASVGALTDTSGATINLRFSDDQGKSWSDYFSVVLTEAVNSTEISFRSLGSFMSPGRVFELSDSGGPIRIDGADAFVDGYDDAQAGPG